jgi:hypothetical protein
MGTELIVSGFPSDSRSVDYDKGHISLARVIIPARYAGEADSGRHKHRIQIVSTGGLLTYDGLSGALVVGDTPRGIAFLGMVIQGAASSSLVHIIGVEVFANFIRRVTKQAAAAAPGAKGTQNGI